MKFLSKRRLKANRANAQKSTGPKAEASKAIVAHHFRARLVGLAISGSTFRDGDYTDKWISFESRRDGVKIQV